MTTRNGYLLILVVAAVTMMGCSQYGPSLGQAALQQNSLISGNAPQAPNIFCTISNPAGTVLATVNNAGITDALNQTNPVEGTVLTVNCSGTNSSASPLKFSVGTNGGALTLKPSSTFTLTTVAGGTPIDINVTDAKGLSTDSKFSLVGACNPSIHPAVAVDPTKVKITASKWNNYYTYDASSAVTGGLGGYLYTWDFNGDGIFDAQLLSSNAWAANSSSPIATNEYNIYAGVRPVGLIVQDLVCGTSQQVTINTNFQIPRLAPGGLAQVEPYYYIQADASGLNGNTDLSANALLTADWFPADPSQHVKCAYDMTKFNQPTGLVISGDNNYGDGSNASLNHGLGLGVNNIADTGAAGTQTFTTTLSQVDYLTAEGGDSAASLDYAKAGNCPVTLHISRATAAVPCASDATAVQSDVVIITGEFSCTDQRVTTLGGVQKDLTLKNGYFFFQVAYTNQCPGGGGQGGGGIPPNPY